MTAKVGNLSVEVAPFLQAAREYARAVESLDTEPSFEQFSALAAALASWYACALHLPDLDIPEDAPEVDDAERWSVPIEKVPELSFGKFDIYWEVFDPYEKDEPINAVLSTNVGELYADARWVIARLENATGDSLLQAIVDCQIRMTMISSHNVTCTVRALDAARRELYELELDLEEE